MWVSVKYMNHDLWNLHLNTASWRVAYKRGMQMPSNTNLLLTDCSPSWKRKAWKACTKASGVNWCKVFWLLQFCLPGKGEFTSLRKRYVRMVSTHYCRYLWFTKSGTESCSNEINYSGGNDVLSSFRLDSQARTYTDNILQSLRPSSLFMKSFQCILHIHSWIVKWISIRCYTCVCDTVTKHPRTVCFNSRKS